MRTAKPAKLSRAIKFNDAMRRAPRVPPPPTGKKAKRPIWRKKPAEGLRNTFRRSFTLPEDADSTKVTAEFRDGVLKVHLPTTTKARSKALEVKVQ
jgi:hypothetical protein